MMLNISIKHGTKNFTKYIFITRLSLKKIFFLHLFFQNWPNDFVNTIFIYNSCIWMIPTCINATTKARIPKVYILVWNQYSTSFIQPCNIRKYGLRRLDTLSRRFFPTIYTGEMTYFACIPVCKASSDKGSTLKEKDLLPVEEIQ